MKAILYVSIILVFVVLICGCTAPVTTQETGAVAVIKTPDIRGNWSGTSTGYIGGKGFTDYPGSVITMRVTDQNNRVFKGDFIFSNQSGFSKTVDFGGVIDRDGKTLTIVERNGGYSYGTFIAPDEIELIHADDAGSSDVAIDSLKRS